MAKIKKQLYKKNLCLESLLLVCIYTTLIELNTPQPLSYLCKLTNVNVKKVWHYLKTNDSFYRPNLMCEFLLNPLNLSFKDVGKIRTVVKQLEREFVFSPKTLIASCSYIFLRERNIKLEIPISQSRLAKQLGISPMTIYRCVKKIEDKTVALCTTIEDH